MGKGMNRKEQRNNRRDKYNTMIKKGPSAKAAQQFIHQAYKSYNVDEYLKKKGVVQIGQKHSD